MGSESTGPKPRMFFIDLETFGLHYLNDPIIEIGISERDLALEQEDSFHGLIWDGHHYDHLLDLHEAQNSVVWKMHAKSGLWAEAQDAGSSSDQIEMELKDWLLEKEMNPKYDYLVGNSVHFDATMLHFNFPEIRAMFHHRLIDTTSIKVLAEIWFPKHAARLKSDITPAKVHRVRPDIEDTVNEMHWYLDNFLPESDELHG